MNKNASYYLKFGSLVLFFIIIVGYSFYQARHIIFGPSVQVFSPINGETYSNPLIDVKGIAQNVDTFSIDDNPVLIDKNGAFDEQLLLAPGYTIIKIDATDKFGKKTEKIIQVILQTKDDENPVPVLPKDTATSTTASTTIN